MLTLNKAGTKALKAFLSANHKRGAQAYEGELIDAWQYRVLSLKRDFPKGGMLLLAGHETKDYRPCSFKLDDSFFSGVKS